MSLPPKDEGMFVPWDISRIHSKILEDTPRLEAPLSTSKHSTVDLLRLRTWACRWPVAFVGFSPGNQVVVSNCKPWSCLWGLWGVFFYLCPQPDFYSIRIKRKACEGIFPLSWKWWNHFKLQLTNNVACCKLEMQRTPCSQKLLIPAIVLNWLQDMLKWSERCIITRCFLRSDKSESKIEWQHEASADQCATSKNNSQKRCKETWQSGTRLNPLLCSRKE